jgi:hypothetical protein
MANNNRCLFKDLPPAQQAILTTILYSDIFSFPLTKEELWKFLISEEKISRVDFERSLLGLKELVIYSDGYYCLKNRQKIILQRMKNLPEVVKKMELAKRAAEKLSHIPSVLFIGISGGLAVKSVDAKDDIDFVIITKKNTLFTTRFMIIAVLESLGIRRSRTQKETANTICVNLMFDETVLSWFGNKKDIYTAREIGQLQPVFERDDMYSRFMKENIWIRQFLPNISRSHFLLQSSGKKKYDTPSWLWINPLTESLQRLSQMSLMKRHQTREVMTKHILALHPNDYRLFSLNKLRLKMRQLGLLTNF